MNDLFVTVVEIDEAPITEDMVEVGIHLSEISVLSHADKLMAGKLSTELTEKHLESCSLCKSRVMNCLNYFGYNELEVK